MRTFLNPSTLRSMRPDLLVAWLAPAANYVAKRGIVLPKCKVGNHLTPTLSPGGEGVVSPVEGLIDYEKLAGIFMEPTKEVPAAFLESVFLIQEMATPAGMDVLLESARSNGIELGLGEDLVPIDVAVKMWLNNPGLLENLHNTAEMTRPRAFRYYLTERDPVPPFFGPTAEQLVSLETRLNGFYVAWKRGRGAKVFAYKNFPLAAAHPDVVTRPSEWWFLVRHGAPCRREPVMENGQPTNIFFRPQKHDVLRYDPVLGEMASLFGDAEYFPGTGKYSLRPLLEQGRSCLACADVPGIDDIKLTGVEFYYRDQPWKRVVQEAPDIFTLVERQELAWPERLETITRATFTVKFRRCKRPRKLTIMPSNKALYGRDGDSGILEHWMGRREFIVKPE
jgi:hypothetical protein